MPEYAKLSVLPVLLLASSAGAQDCALGQRYLDLAKGQGGEFAHEEAIAFLEQSIAACPQYEAYQQLGDLAAQSLEQADKGRAAEAFVAAHERAPTDAEPRRSLFTYARLLRVNNDPQNAYPLIKEAQTSIRRTPISRRCRASSMRRSAILPRTTSSEDSRACSLGLCAARPPPRTTTAQKWVRPRTPAPPSIFRSTSRSAERSSTTRRDRTSRSSRTPSQTLRMPIAGSCSSGMPTCEATSRPTLHCRVAAPRPFTTASSFSGRSFATVSRSSAAGGIRATCAPLRRGGAPREPSVAGVHPIAPGTEAGNSQSRSASTSASLPPDVACRTTMPW